MTSRSFGHYIFIDESGSLTQSTDWHMVVCAVVTTDRRKLNQIVRDARRKNRSSPVTRGWLHAVDDDPATVEFLLRQAVKVGDIWFASSVLDKRYYLDRHEHPNEVYQKFVAFTVQRALETLEISAVDSSVSTGAQFHKSCAQPKFAMAYSK